MKHSFNLTRLITASLFFSLLVFVSCQKETSSGGTDAEEFEASLASSEGDSEAEVTFNSIFDDAMGANDDVGLAGTGVFYGRSNTNESGDVARGDSLSPVTRCFTVTITHPNSTPFPVRILIDFGTAGCRGPDGNLRKGKIITEYTNRLLVPGATATTVFDGFYINDVKVEGTHKITNMSGPNTLPLSRKFKVEVIDGKLTKPNGNYVEWNSVKTITQIEGLITPDLARDDVFKIEGSARGRVKRGTLLVGWESTITEPLIKRFTCRWIVRGRIKTIRVNATANSPWIAVLDFGAGTCDNQATITVNGVTRQITLP